MKTEFSVYEYIGGGKGFEVGKLYPVLGWNNGEHIISESKTGDIVDTEAYTCQDGTLFTDDGAVFEFVSWKVRKIMTYLRRKGAERMMKKWGKEHDK
jgi:hypothetical protein